MAVKTIPRDNGSGERVEREARAAAAPQPPGHRRNLRVGLRRPRRISGLRARSGPNPGPSCCAWGPWPIATWPGSGWPCATRSSTLTRGGDPPRCQAGQCDGARRARRRRRLCQAGRLRSGTRDRRDPLDAYRRRGWDARLHGPRAGRGNEGDPGVRRYSLALSLYEAWTGTNPIRAGGPAATARRLGRPLPSLARRAPRPATRAVRRDRRCARRRPGPPPRPGGLRAAFAAAVPELDDQGGLVEPATLRRVGLATAERRRSLWSRPAGWEARQSATAGEAGGRPARGRDRLRRPRDRSAPSRRSPRPPRRESPLSP